MNHRIEAHVDDPSVREDCPKDRSLTINAFMVETFSLLQELDRQVPLNGSEMQTIKDESMAARLNDVARRVIVFDLKDKVYYALGKITWDIFQSQS